MSHKINIILAKASWCPHCVDFTPIYELARKKINAQMQLDNCEIDFDSYELDKDIQANEFKQKYPGLIDFLEGYPTVFFRMTEKQNNNPVKVKTEFINHSVANGGTQQAMNNAAEEFIQNIINKYKSILSGGKELHISVQKGGMSNYMTSNQEVKYRNKYLKYKSKYLTLKNN
jgi:thiol-disulfide isomerase/thioredoxin